ncbi:MAG: carbohydrate ABC transporter permease [SAR324 cluster bacterium]|nr:carbohydrate ABC transporter permease [SAR324 cluster bacterium]
MSSNKFWRSLIYITLLVFAAFYLLPIYVMLTTSFKSVDEIRTGHILSWPNVFTTDAWGKAWFDACIGISCEGINKYFWNSVKMVIPAVLLSTLPGAFNGYVLTKWRFPGHNIVFGLLLFSCFIPFQIVLIPTATVLGKLGIADSTLGLILVHMAYGLGFTTLFFRNFYQAFPDELVRAARIDGAGFFTIFWRIMLPSSGPIIAISVIWQFTNIWNDFLFGASFTSGANSPITVALNNLANSSTGAKEYNVDMAAAIYAALPTLVAYVFAGKYFIKGLLAGSVKG